jgi:hypothetical protein
LLVLRLLLLLDDNLDLFIGFWSSSCASWGFGFEIQTFLLVLWLLLLLDGNLELFIGFWSSSYASWGLEFEI